MATTKIGKRVQLRFRISQHIRDLSLMNSNVTYLQIGNTYIYPNEAAVSLNITKFSDIKNTIIPLLDKHPILGVKQQDYQDWCKVATLMTKGEHLTVEGLQIIEEIKNKMNKNRTI